jgi:hypothetical protein
LNSYGLGDGDDYFAHTHSDLTTPLRFLQYSCGPLTVEVEDTCSSAPVRPVDRPPASTVLLRESGECMCCMDASATFVFASCGHLICCASCRRRLVYKVHMRCRLDLRATSLAVGDGGLTGSLGRPPEGLSGLPGQELAGHPREQFPRAPGPGAATASLAACKFGRQGACKELHTRGVCGLPKMRDLDQNLLEETSVSCPVCRLVGVMVPKRKHKGAVYRP